MAQAEQNFAPQVVSLPIYKYRIIKPIAAIGTVARTSTTEVQFEFPVSEVGNLSKSYIQLGLTLPASGAGNQIRTWYQLGKRSPFQSMRLFFDNGHEVHNLTDLPTLSKMALDYCMSPSEWEQKQVVDEDASKASLGMGPISGLVSVTQNKHLDITSNLQAVGRSYWKPKEVYESSANNTALACVWRIPLNEICPHSFLSKQQDFWPKSKMTLSLTFAMTDDWAFICADGTDLSGGATLASDPTVQELSLYYAVQKNEAIVSAIQSKVNSEGMRIPYGAPFEMKTLTNSATSFSRILKLNNSLGRKLLRIYHGHFLSPNIGNRYNCSNYNATVGLGTSFTAIRSNLDGNYESDYNLAPIDVYHMNKDQLVHTIINSASQMDQNGCYMRDYSGLRGSQLFGNEGNECGLDLSQPIDWTVETTNAGNNYTVISWVIAQKILNVNANGCTVSVM